MEREILILDGARTPFGSFGGSLKDVSAVDLGARAIRAALDRSGIPAERVDHVVLGNVMQTSPDAIYMARLAGLKAGLSIATPGLTVNRLCGSGLQAVVSAAQLLLLGEAQVVAAGGTENMSQTPYVLRGARWGYRMGHGVMGDYLIEGLTDPYCGCSMGETAENLQAKYGITRQEQDDFALRSHRQAQKARESGRFAQEIVPVEVPDRKGSRLVEHDEHIRMDADGEKMAVLRPVMKMDGTVTAGNASGINDGAAALVVTTREKAEMLSARPLGRILSWGYAGVQPEIMGIGPVTACRQALDRAGLTLSEMDLVEVNEAFAAQYLAVERELGLDREKVNVNGGAIALGHPLGASGARLLLTLLYELRERHKRFGMASLCIGGGQGIAMIVERMAV